MRVLVTGATGFIGSHLTRLLVRHGCEVHALIRAQADVRRIADVLPSLHVVRGDLGSLELLTPSLGEIRPDACFHLAWYAVPGRYLTAPENLDMLEAGIRLFRLLAQVGSRTLVAAGSCFEYDTDLGYLSETTPTRPRTLYAATKLSLQLAAAHWASAAGLRLVWPRLFYQFGPWEDERRLVPAVILSLLRQEKFRTTAGSRIRDYLDVEDVAAALHSLLDSRLEGPVNVGSGRPVAVRDIARLIGDALGRPELLDLSDEVVDGPDPAFICADNRRLRAGTRWSPRYSLEDGLQRAVDWWRWQAQRRA